VFKYTFKDKEHYYIPDFFIPTLNLVIEIKSSTNNHYRLRDIEQEKEKDRVLEKSKYNYIKIFDKDYSEFLEKLIKGKWK
jgi:very-short-patch-repair endonuclease